MIETRKRSGRGRIKTAAVFLALGSLGAAYGCSSDNASNPNEGLGGAGGGGGQSCGMKVNNAADYPPCNSCTGGRCVPKSLVAAQNVSSLLTPCDADNVCVPDNIVEMGQNLQLATCTSVAGGEGRCASTCIGIVAALGDYLPTAGCGANERCAPCFNPANGQPTGLCNLGCDKGPTGTAVKFGTCCGADGLCAPKSTLPAALAGQLGPETCANSATDVCVPAKPIATPGSRFPCCTIDLSGGSTIAGACAPACVINAGPNGASLPKGSCATDAEKCVPCADGSGAPTGACSDATGKPSATCTPP